MSEFAWCFVSVRASGHADEGSVLQGRWPTRSSDQRAAAGASVPPAFLRSGTGHRARCGQHNQLLQHGLQRGQRRQGVINSRFSWSGGGNPRLCSVWNQRHEGNSSLKDFSVWGWTQTWSKTTTKHHVTNHVFFVCGKNGQALFKKSFTNKLWDSSALPSLLLIIRPLEGSMYRRKIMASIYSVISKHYTF